MKLIGLSIDYMGSFKLPDGKERPIEAWIKVAQQNFQIITKLYQVPFIEHVENLLQLNNI